MSEPLAGVRMTAAVVAALRLASTRRRPNNALSTLDILLALQASDATGAWSRFLIDERPQDNPIPASGDTWEGVPLTGEAAAALTRARRIGEAYRLTPLPPGVLALAVAWNRNSAAARAFVGTDHAQLLNDIQDDVLGTQLRGLERLDEEDPPRRDDPPEISDLEAVRALSEVTPLLPAWLLCLLTVAAALGVWFSLTSAPSWSFRADDDLRPPVERPAVAAAIPTTAELDSTLNLHLVRDQDGLPQSRLFDSVLPSAWDIRHEVITGAWADHWSSTDGKTEVSVQLVSTRVDYSKVDLVTRFVDDCIPSGSSTDPNVTERSGYQTHTSTFASYCSLSRVGQTQIYVGVETFDPAAMAELPRRVAGVISSIQRALPPTTGRLVTQLSTPYETAQIRRTWLSVILLIPLLWLGPTLLLDRAFWQRFRASLFLRRFTSFPLPGVDIDRVVRARLWSSAFTACVQALVAICVLRLCWEWGPLNDLIEDIGARVGSSLAGPIDLGLALIAALAVGMLPRLLHRRRTARTGAFAGSRRVLWVTGLALSLVAFAVAYFAMWLGVAMSALGTGNGPDYAQERLSLVFRLAAIPIVLIAITPMTLVRRVAMRALRTREAPDLRPPILLLRSFTDDGVKVRARGNQRRSLIDRLSLRRWERFEEVVAAALSVQGPVLGVGQVGERLPPALGAVRRQFTNDEWQNAVHGLMAQASLICITLGRTESLAWEISRIADSGYLGKTIFVLPPTKRAEHIRRLAVLAHILELNWVDVDVSPTGGWALAVRVEGKGAVPQIIRARAQEDVAYDVALEMMRLRVLGWTWPTTSLADEFHVAAPRAEIYQRGKAPRPKSWWRRPWLLLLLVNITGVAALPTLFLTGESAKASTTLDLGTSTAWDVAADQRTGDMYSIIDGKGIYRLTIKGDDEPEMTARKVAQIATAEYLTASDGWLFAANPVDGTLQGIAPGSAKPTWSRDDLPGVLRVVAAGEELYVAVPSRKQVIAIDRSTGKDSAIVKTDGTPWSLAVQGDTLAVSLADHSTVLEFALSDLKPSGQLETTSPMTSVVAANGTLWSYSPSEHALDALAGPDKGNRILTRSESPVFASNGAVLAIGGVEMITTERPSGAVYRNRYFPRHPSAMAVTHAGDVLAATDNQLVFIKASTD